MPPRLTVGFLNHILGQVSITAQAVRKPVQFLPMQFHQRLVAKLTGLIGRIGLHHHILTPWRLFPIATARPEHFPPKLQPHFA